MSKVSLKNNDALPTFEPLNQAKVTTQKRKRNAAALNDSANGTQQISKKPKSKRNTADSTEPIKSFVWIGATLMQSNAESEEPTAAFSIFYGLNDKRNVTEKVTLKQNQDLNHVYIMGALRALENCGNENTVLSIYTGDKDIQSAINQEDQDTVYDEIKEKIAKRKGTTVIRSASSGKNEEQTIANKMAADMLLEDEAMALDNEKAVAVDIEAKTEVSVTTVVEETAVVEELAIVEEIKTEDVEMIEKSEEVTITNSTVIVKEEPAPVAAPSWADTLNLRNLLDILKAPFVRNKRN